MISKNTLAAAGASAGIAAAMLPTSAGAAVAPQPPSTTAGGIGTVTGGVVDTARKSGEGQREFFQDGGGAPAPDVVGALGTIASGLASGLMGLLS
jgi:hypothetical protein